MLNSFARSTDKATVDAANMALESPPDLTDFHKELTEAVADIVSKGLDEDFKAFVNHYMEPALEERVTSSAGQFGDNVSRVCSIKDPHTDWVPAVICYNLILYIKAYGLESLKRCKVCAKIFDHKGKYAVYCDDRCKTKAKTEATPK
jgi:hypothetical protein